jgi:hypothetical protein
MPENSSIAPEVKTCFQKAGAREMPDERCLFEIGLGFESTGGTAGWAGREREGYFTIRGSAGMTIL